ncbi:glycosyltransferase family 1 protein [Crassaminicella thermophila]|uniref:Glycosyltransferase family 1 protein n=1 Tax=Crassaminicella thermophila TaxID=2599308 RepID=A0A5C0SDH5_CRATE|nr:glycosyltransferase [Crassaminicella thermophila]QEK11448.1 glycosyltransferase family 1 protein [Crassaminicella thermophila]
MKKSVLIFSLLNWESKLLHREHMLAKYFSKKGFDVYYIQKENIRSFNQLKLKPNIYKDNDINIVSVQAFPYFKGKIKSIYNINDYIIKKQLKEIFYLFKDPLIILESPYWIKGIEESRDNKGIICYDISDDLSQFATNEKWKKQLLSYERETINRSDILFVTAEKLKEKAKNHPNLYLVENGVDLDEFKNAKKILKDYDGPICGFIGGIFEWIDFDLIDKAAKRYPNYNFVLIGPTDRPNKLEYLCKNSNVYYLGEKDKKEIGNYYASFDIGLIPFVSEESYPRLKTVNSNKVFQYCYFGYPVLSTSFTQVRGLKDFVSVCESKEEFINKIEICLKENNMDLENKRKSYAMENSWENKVEQMIAFVKNIGV